MTIDRKPSIFSVRVKELREKRGFTMQYIGERIGVARSTYAGYETQDRFPSVDKLTKLVRVLNTSVDYLIGLTDNPETKDPTHNIVEYLETVDDLNWNGIPLSNDDLKPLRDLFSIVIRERLPKINEEIKEDEQK